MAPLHLLLSIYPFTFHLHKFSFMCVCLTFTFITLRHFFSPQYFKYAYIYPCLSVWFFNYIWILLTCPSSPTRNWLTCFFPLPLPLFTFLLTSKVQASKHVHYFSSERALWSTFWLMHQCSHCDSRVNQQTLSLFILLKFTVVTFTLWINLAMFFCDAHWPASSRFVCVHLQPPWGNLSPFFSFSFSFPSPSCLCPDSVFRLAEVKLFHSTLSP